MIGDRSLISALARRPKCASGVIMKTLTSLGCAITTQNALLEVVFMKVALLFKNSINAISPTSSFPATRVFPCALYIALVYDHLHILQLAIHVAAVIKKSTPLVVLFPALNPHAGVGSGYEACSSIGRRNHMT